MAVLKRDLSPVDATFGRMQRRADAADQERARVAAAKPARIGHARGGSERVEIYDGRERVTLIGHDTFARPLRALPSLSEGAKATGSLYGAISEQLHLPGLAVLNMDGPRGGSCGESPVERLIRLRDLQVRAQYVLDRMAPMVPQRRSRKVTGTTLAIRSFAARAPEGHMIDARQPIAARRLGDMICIEDQTISDILQRHGWTGSTGNRKALTACLGAALSLIGIDWGTVACGKVKKRG